jgi:NAD(P)-dependent dehydrogenase (short-subunit alcohol dehydrogenase family)
MSNREAIRKGNVALVTGGADGIGLASAKYFADKGMSVYVADINDEKLTLASKESPDLTAVHTDVTDLSQVEALRDRIYAEKGQLNILMNNAGSGFGTGCWTEYDNWRNTLDLNVYGVVHGLQVFVPSMLEEGNPGVVINTGSKQGITNPPGDPAYNASKAAVKAITEQLAHSFLNTENCNLTAHLLVPGFVYTGIVSKWLPEKPEGAWWPDQVAEFMGAALERGDFYIICPDNDVDRNRDNKRMAWAMGDLIENRPALSRWNPQYVEAFESFESE